MLGKTIATNTADIVLRAPQAESHYGVFHQLSKHYLHRYCDEFGFRWNLRDLSDVLATMGWIGKRLMYKEPAEDV